MTSHLQSTPDNRYFEDYVPGAVHEFGSIAVDEKEVIEFGKRYVPLSYHVDKEAAKNSIYGGVIASAAEPTPTKAPDLMAALEESLAAVKGEPLAAGSKSKSKPSSTKRKTPAKSSSRSRSKAKASK